MGKPLSSYISGSTVVVKVRIRTRLTTRLWTRDVERRVFDIYITSAISTRFKLMNDGGKALAKLT